MTDSAACAAIGPSDFKNLMRGVASTVSVVTTVNEGEPHGMTATAFSSVSADPPTVLIVLNKSTRSHPLISASRLFVVNMLQEDQVELSARFAGKLDDQFADIRWRRGRTGAPILNDVLSYFECETVSEVDVGTHTIFVGRVIGGEASSKPPLLYHRGQYKSLVDTDA
jgi:flavin reductase (DIM6/NTAB) family NADH-FMN oxidoreductase RutF